MKRIAARLATAIATPLGIRVSRAGAVNRFDAMSDSLVLLRRLGYAPRVVIDVGANEGQWYSAARAVFPAAVFHLVEPQPFYWPALQKLDAVVHPVAASAPGTDVVRLLGAGPSGSTGAFVAADGEFGDDEIMCSAVTLDRMLDERVTVTDRALVKLDVEGHELPALAGAEQLLARAEVIVAETRFYRDESDARATFADLLLFLRARGFELFDIATLSSRPRDGRLRQADVVFVRRDSVLAGDASWA